MTLNGNNFLSSWSILEILSVWKGEIKKCYQKFRTVPETIATNAGIDSMADLPSPASERLYPGIADFKELSRNRPRSNSTEYEYSEPHLFREPKNSRIGQDLRNMWPFKVTCILAIWQKNHKICTLNKNTAMLKREIHYAPPLVSVNRFWWMNLDIVSRIMRKYRFACYFERLVLRAPKELEARVTFFEKLWSSSIDCANLFLKKRRFDNYALLYQTSRQKSENPDPRMRATPPQLSF